MVAHTPNFLTLVTDAGQEKTVNVSELTFIEYEAFSLIRSMGLGGITVGGGLMVGVLVVGIYMIYLIIEAYDGGAIIP